MSINSYIFSVKERQQSFGTDAASTLVWTMQYMISFRILTSKHKLSGTVPYILFFLVLVYLNILMYIIQRGLVCFHYKIKNALEYDTAVHNNIWQFSRECGGQNWRSEDIKHLHRSFITILTEILTASGRCIRNCRGR